MKYSRILSAVLMAGFVLVAGQDPARSQVLPASQAMGSSGDLDEFLCYRAKLADPLSSGPDREVDLADQFEERRFRVIIEPQLTGHDLSSLDFTAFRILCNPAERNSGAPMDPLRHLEGYKIKPIKIDRTQPKHARTNIRVENEFGVIFVDVKRPSLLLLPATVAAGGSVPLTTERFKCYETRGSKGSPKFSGIQVSIADEFTPPKIFNIVRPSTLCVPVDMNGEGIENPHPHLMCYKIKAARGEPKHEKLFVEVASEFAVEVLKTISEDELCMPSTITTGGGS